MSDRIKILNVGNNICGQSSSNCFKIVNVGKDICTPESANCLKINAIRYLLQLNTPEVSISEITNTSFINQFPSVFGATRYHYQLSLNSDFSQIEREVYLQQVEPPGTLMGGATTDLTPGALYYQRIRSENVNLGISSNYTINSIQLLI
jgi:hypothetical protein